MAVNAGLCCTRVRIPKSESPIPAALDKRFGVDANSDALNCVAGWDGAAPLVLSHESLKPDQIDAEVAKFFKPVKAKQGDSLVVFGWIMAEELLKFA